MFQRLRTRRVLVFVLVAAFALAGWAPVRAWQEGARQEQPASRPRRTDEAAAPTSPATAPQTSQQQQQQPPAKPRPAPRNDDETLDDDDVVRFETDLTNVLFTAVDRNKRFITTIRKEDVRLLEDGVPQEVFTFQRETERPLSLAIVIDTSISQERTLPEEKSAAQAFVDAVIRTNKDEVAVLSFTGDTTLEQGLTGNASRVRRAIDKVEFVPPAGYVGGGTVINIPGATPPISGDNQRRAGSTAIWDALWVTSKEVLSETSDKTRRAIILLTDGVDTSSRLKADEAINEAHKADAIIYAIGIGDDFFDGVEEASLRRVSERTGGRAYFPRSETDLRAAFRQIQEELRSQYLLAYSPSNKSKDGTFRKVQLEIINPELQKQNLRLTYRQGYFAQSATGPKKK